MSDYPDTFAEWWECTKDLFVEWAKRGFRKPPPDVSMTYTEAQRTLNRMASARVEKAMKSKKEQGNAS